MTTHKDMIYYLGGVPVANDAPWMASISNAYFVDGTYGKAGGGGKSWDSAFNTIQAAITASNATINWSYTPKRYNVIYVAPGVYAENLTTPYYCHLFGTGIRGTDTATEIHPTTGSCMTGTFLGTHVQNIHFEVDEAVDCLNLGTCNNSLIEDCTFTNGAAVAATAISTDNCSHLTVQRCSVESGQLTGMAYGLYFQGGDNKFAHNVRIVNNVIFCDTAGIWVQDTCTASQAVFAYNLIARPVKGIHDNNGGSYCYKNNISASTAAIDHPNSSTQCIDNQVIDNATAARQAAYP